MKRNLRNRCGNGPEIAHSPGNPIHGLAGSEALEQTAVNGKKTQGRAPVDDSLIAIVVVVMVAWEFIQFAIPENARGERVTGRDASDKERVPESPSLRDTQKLNCSLHKDQ
jgi:hypothetical protein